MVNFLAVIMVGPFKHDAAKAEVRLIDCYYSEVLYTDIQEWYASKCRVFCECSEHDIRPDGWQHDDPCLNIKINPSISRLRDSR